MIVYHIVLYCTVRNKCNMGTLLIEDFNLGNVI